MSLDYGSVRTYKERGFGFLRSQLFEREVFFHISRVKDQAARRDLAVSTDRKVVDVRLWYTVERTPKGYEATETWFALHEVPDGLVSSFATTMLERISTNHDIDGDGQVAILSLMNNNTFSQDQLLAILGSRYGLKNPLDIITRLDEQYKPKAIDALQIPERWMNASSTLPSWLTPVTLDLLGEAELLKLQRRRHEEEVVEVFSKRYSLDLVQARELYDLLVSMLPLGFTNSKQLSEYIVKMQLGLRYPNIAGIVRMQLREDSWDFNGGFPPNIYRAVCMELKLGNQGTKAVAVGFIPFKDLVGNSRQS